jgi:hypothetical protein
MIRSRFAAPMAALAAFTGVVLSGERTARADDETGVLSSHHRTYESPQNFAFELRLGAYHPRIDTASDLGASGPYQAEFGDGLRFEVSAEFDWQAYRIPHFGTIGPGISLGYTSSSALAPLVHPVNGSTLSGETTSLDIFPTYAVAVLRVDVLNRELKVPLIPFVKAGFGLAFWRASNSGGTSYYNGVIGEGHTVGTQLAVGLALDLNFLDRRTSQGFDNATGVNHTFLFGELDDYNLNGLWGLQKNALYVGNQNWTVGLGFEF